jgi:hypothetical protein
LSISGVTWNVIPVTRYGSGMSRGMYHKDTSNQYCGTFYYSEPESTTYLAYMTSRTYFNKTDALIKLGEEFGKNYIDQSDIDSGVNLHLSGKLPQDLMMTPIEYTEFMLRKIGEGYYPDNQRKYSMEEARSVPNIPHYVGDQFGLYAQEDPYDQEVCLAARENGIQLIILTNMVGSHQVVTEILDTRDRKESFRSLIYTQ